MKNIRRKYDGLKSLLASLSRKPTGFIGKLMSKIMNKSNEQMNNMVVKLLHIKEKDCVLEIGFGNGKYIKEIINSVKGVSVYGLDFSETMVQIATKVNSSYIKQGRVCIKQGSIEEIPFD